MMVCCCYALFALWSPPRARTLLLHIGAVLLEQDSGPLRPCTTRFPHSVAMVSARRNVPIDDKLISWVKRMECDLYFSAGSRVWRALVGGAMSTLARLHTVLAPG